MTLPVLYYATVLQTLRHRIRITLSRTSHRTIRARSSAGRIDRAAVADRRFDMTTFPNKEGELQPRTTESRTDNPKETLQPRTLAPSSVPISNPPGEEKKNNHTSPAPVHNNETRDLPDQEDLHLPGNVERWYLAAFFWIMIVCGWSDGTT
jgi:hypothetical protein